MEIVTSRFSSGVVRRQTWPLSYSTPTQAKNGPFQMWKKGKVIGHGSFGRVYKVVDCIEGCPYAMKEAPVRDGEEAFIESLKDTLALYRAVRHPNIIQMIGYEDAPSHLSIFLEFMPGGESIKQRLQEFGPLTLPALQDTTRGCLQGLQHLHSLSPALIHGEVRSSNVLFAFSDGKVIVKLTDYFRTHSIAAKKIYDTLGSLPWTAPEVITSQTGSSTAADIWSLGCTVVEMATAEQPWGNSAFNNFRGGFECISKPGAVPPIPGHLPKACQDFVQKCLQRDPSRRWSAEDLSLHPFSANAAERPGAKDKQ